MKIQNRDRLRRKILSLPAFVRQELGAALQKSGDEITSIQKTLAPEEDGTLKGTIRNTYDESDLRVTMTAGGPETTKPIREGLSADYDYALAQEFGTKEMPANPFFFPGYRLGKKRAKSRITRGINKAAKRVVQG